jgi:hypothetical protein
MGKRTGILSWMTMKRDEVIRNTVKDFLFSPGGIGL